MGDVLIEGELEFDFRKAIRAERFDEEKRHRMSHCMKAVDFLVEWPDALWFIEVKDPSKSSIPDHLSNKERRNFIERMKKKVLFHEELGPKAKDSFLYLHLMGEVPEKPIKYFVLLALRELDKALLSFSARELKQASCLIGPNNSEWRNRYICAAAVYNLETWNQHLGHCPVRRCL